MGKKRAAYKPPYKNRPAVGAAAANAVAATALAATVVGTFIGAGFASGRELIEFFGGYGFSGIVYAALACAAFCAISAGVMLQARRVAARSYRDAIDTGSKLLSGAVDIFISLNSFMMLIVMIAGSGALFRALFGVAEVWGGAFMALAVILTACIGGGKLLECFSLVVPPMILVALAVSIVYLATRGIPHTLPIAPAPTRSAPVSALLYIGYNFTAALATFTPLGTMAKSRKSIIGGSILAGAALALPASLTILSMLASGNVHSSALPMFELARSISPLMAGAYAFVLLAGVYTTAAGLLFALEERFESRKHMRGGDTGALLGMIPKNKEKAAFSAALTISAFVLSNFGFSELVSLLYPISGAFSVVLMGLFLIRLSQKPRGSGLASPGGFNREWRHARRERKPLLVKGFLARSAGCEAQAERLRRKREV